MPSEKHLQRTIFVRCGRFFVPSVKKRRFFDKMLKSLQKKCLQKDDSVVKYKGI